MTDDPKPPWHKSIPGVLTTATGFIAAVSGLLAGLNQLGVFRREPPPSAVVGISPTPSDHTAQDTTAAGRGPEPGPAVVEPPPGAVRAPSSPPATTPAEPPTATTPAGTRLAKGTVLELTVPARTCAPEDGQRRFTARLASPVRASGADCPAGRDHRRPPSPPRRQPRGTACPPRLAGAPRPRGRRAYVPGADPARLGQRRLPPCRRADARGPGREPEYPTPLTLRFLRPTRRGVAIQRLAVAVRAL